MFVILLQEVLTGLEPYQLENETVVSEKTEWWNWKLVNLLFIR